MEREPLRAWDSSCWNQFKRSKEGRLERWRIFENQAWFTFDFKRRFWRSWHCNSWKLFYYLRWCFLSCSLFLQALSKSWSETFISNPFLGWCCYCMFTSLIFGILLYLWMIILYLVDLCVMIFSSLFNTPDSGSLYYCP